MTPLELRLTLKRRGYNPIPVNGKRPFLNGWEKQLDTTVEEINLWSRMRPAEENTGLLTLTTPAFDIDILDPDAAEAVERLARERFEELGEIIVRFGLPPKRAILFRTDAPFDKIAATFGTGEKVECLGKGQQIVVAGIHPDTHRPYEWFGGSPHEVDRANLPYIHAEEARELVETAARLLIDQFGYQLPQPRRSRRSNGNGGPANWSIGPEDLIDHDKLAALAMRFVKAGMNGGALHNMLSSNIEALEGVDEERRARRLRELPGIVSSAEAKLGQDEAPPSPPDPPQPPRPFRSRVELTDFYAFMPKGKALIFAATGALWPGGNVDKRVPPVQVGVDQDGEPVRIPASMWLYQNRVVDQMTWAPGEPQIIENRLMLDTGFIDAEGKSAFNLYHPPSIRPGDPAKPEPWLELGRTLYPDDFDHLVKCFAQRVQFPGVKINHAILLGGDPGIGKDSLLAPVLAAVGAGNVADISPMEILTSAFTGFRKCVIMRISEAHDIGEAHRRVLYERMKTLCAAPPETLRVNEKNVPEYYVLNVCLPIITTNHKMDALYLPEDDRRTYVAWSRLRNEDFADDYWRRYWKFLYEGGVWHVAAYLRSYDLSGFDPKTPPPKTAAFWTIVNHSKAPEDAEMSDALDELTAHGTVEGWPAVLTIGDIFTYASDTLKTYLSDQKNRKSLPHRLDSLGYEQVTNPGQKDGRWKIGGENKFVYGRRDLSVRDQLAAVRKKYGIYT